MGRERNGKIIAIIALLVAIAGLSLGFAAFSTTLNITSSADVPIDSSVWNVGFSTVTSGITPGIVNGKTSNVNNGSLNLTQFVISQNAVAELTTTDGSKVEYDFYIVNDGSLDAYLNAVNMGNLSCAYKSITDRTINDNHTTISSGTGTISDTDCRILFSAKLTIGSNDYMNGVSTSSGFGNTNKLDKPTTNPTYVNAKLTIYYNNGSLTSVTNVPNGDFTVSLSNSVVIYGTNSN